MMDEKKNIEELQKELIKRILKTYIFECESDKVKLFTVIDEVFELCLKEFD